MKEVVPECPVYNTIQDICGKCKFGFEGITAEYILNDAEHCNFCDVPYIIMEFEEEVKDEGASIV